MHMLRPIVTALVIFILISIAILFLPWDRINWGRISILPAATITVTGTSQGEQANQIATFGAAVTATNDDKQKATDEVNTKMTALLNAVKTFGIPDADIKTENVSVSQQEKPTTLIYP